MNVRYRVELSQSERDELGALVSGGKQPVRRLKRMQILLAADAGVNDEAIAASVQTSGSTIYRTKKRFLITHYHQPFLVDTQREQMAVFRRVDRWRVTRFSFRKA
jgi:hypothetical protein